MTTIVFIVKSQCAEKSWNLDETRPPILDNGNGEIKDDA